MLRRIRTVLGLAALVAVALASASSGQPAGPAGPPGGSPPGLDKAIAAKERHAERLLDTPGIAGIGVGLNPAGKPIIRIYKEKPDVAAVPDSLDGVPVESLNTGILQARAPTDRFPRPVPIGVSSGHYQTATGTLGARVTDGTNVYALSNNHVFAGVNTANLGDPILQPGPVEDGGTDPADRIGTLHDYQTINFAAGSTNTIDAAVALTSTANVGTATPVDGYGTPSSITTQAYIGQAVQKYGRTTGLQLGSVTETNVTVDVCYAIIIVCFQEARFVNQISVSPGTFSAAGDSGSLIVTQGANQPVALLFAGGDGLTIGNPIDAVLQRFNVTIDGSVPPDGPPGAPTGLSAVAGNASVALSWSAPAFDGGSPITGSKVYRGTSPNGESFLANTGTGTSYTDSSAVNGTTYYYKVSAVNQLVGEGPLSGEASATPADLVLPTEPLPTLDGFNRANENPLSDSGKWSNAVNGGVETGLKVDSNTLACSASSTCTAWRNNAQYGPESEVWSRISTLPGNGNAIRLYARVQAPGTSGYDGYMLRTNQLAVTDEVFLERIDNSSVVRLLTLNQELAANDILLLRAKGSTLEAWRYAGFWSRLGVVQDSTYGAAGYVGVGLRGTTGRLDDFGARTPGVAATPPDAPTGLSAVAGNASVALSWSAPAFDGGSPITGSKVYRGTSPNGESFLANTGTGTSYTDSSAVNGTTYYYKVSAVNQLVGEGPLSGEASATPADLVLPTEPLPTLDGFNRANENPLSDSGKWSNAVNGGVETGLKVDSNTLACSASSTCTAWRNNAQYGPESEVWSRISTLPGNGNAIRLYARVQAPGTSGYDGYMLRTNQLAVTDEVFLERIDNSSVVRLLTLNQELAANDILLLRAKGSTLEAWRYAGFWSRLGVVQDSTYGAAGYVGVGLRGTTGRLDDFGARTPGVAATPPDAPTGLSAVAGNASVALSWSAPAFDGGSPITGYKVYRGTSPNGESFLANTGTGTSYTDSSAVNGTTYYYKVSAVNLPAGEGGLSGEASATPTAPPTAPGAPTGLSAVAGNASVALSWSAPAFDGGSPITGYKVYRGTSPNGESFLANTGTGTSYTDSSAVNGTTYYYKVSAVNLPAGEGGLSGEASATPTAPPTAPGAPTGLSAVAGNASVALSWSAPAFDGGSPITGYKVYRGTSPNGESFLANTGTGTSYTDSSAVNGTTYYYKVSAVNLPAGEGGLSGEASATPTAPPTAPGAPTGLSAVAGNASVALSWSAPAFDGGSPITGYKVYRGTSPNGESFLANTGTGTSYTDSSAVNGTTYYYKVSAVNLPAGEGGLSGEASATPTAPPTAPGAPTGLSAVAGNASVALSWSAPAFDGGSPITGYKVYRGTSPNGESFLANTGTGTSYTDSSAVNGTTYYYKVSAVNLPAGEGGLSGEASATPTDLVFPVEPLPAPVDNFNRANENPLSNGGTWGRGIIGSAERSLKVVSNQLASDRSTTATAWRNNVQYGPDAEAWATITTLPGNGNAFRLYVRLQAPGSSAADGYMLLFTQASGTDQVALYRLTNGTLTVLQTVNYEVGVGNRLLLRAKGTALESWVKAGSTWTRLGRVTDSTYIGAGYVGVGIRGKTGRLDDFGAR